MPFSRRSFLLCFVSLCIAFVPVLIFGGFWLAIEPVSALILDMFRIGFDRIAILMGIHVLVYIGVFTAVGALAYFLMRLIPWRTAQWFALAVLLSFPVCCTFARVLTYSDFEGSGGTYTFWEAVHRYFERRHNQAHPTPETSAEWQLSQISLHGEWYPSVALSGAAESLEDYLNRIDLSAVSPRQLTLYLDYVLSEQIEPEHQPAYAAALDEIFARAKAIASARGITLRCGVGRGDVIAYRAGERDAFVQRARADPKLAVTTHMGNGFGLSITVTNLAQTPYTRANYGKDFRGRAKYIDEVQIQW